MTVIPSNRLAIDVSNNNPISEVLLRKANPALLICKATEGDSFSDSTYHQHRRMAASLGIRFGSYLFLHPKSKGNEAQHFLHFATPQKTDIVAVDVEVADGAPMSVVASRALSALNYLQSNGIHHPLIYCSSSWYAELVYNQPALNKYRVWEAQYPGKYSKWFPNLASARVKLGRNSSVVLWQWTDRFAIGNHFYDASRLLVPIDSL